jgi:hypothetical protein
MVPVGLNVPVLAGASLPEHYGRVGGRAVFGTPPPLGWCGAAPATCGAGPPPAPLSWWGWSSGF